MIKIFSALAQMEICPITFYIIDTSPMSMPIKIHIGVRLMQNSPLAMPIKFSLAYTGGEFHI